ncbi:MAG: hypothetical protein R3E14_12455 [Erythrobacter sp.]
MRKILALAVCLAAPVAAQDKPADAAQVVEAIEACKTITSPTWIELKQLPSLGWHPLEKRGGGRSTMKVRGIYEKPHNEALIILGKDELKAKSCAIFARLDKTSDYGPLAQSVSQIIGMPNRAEGPTYFWTLGDKALRLDPTGDRKKPIARFEITAIPQESAE